MHQHARHALANPVFNPDTQLGPGHNWTPERGVSAGLSCNIGME